MAALADPGAARADLERRRQRRADAKLPLQISAVLVGGTLWWHFTPWEDAAFWGPFGCGQAKAVMNMVPEGCESYAPPSPRQIVVGNETVRVTQATASDGRRVWTEARQ